jgi:hypothetical protein
MLMLLLPLAPVPAIAQEVEDADADYDEEEEEVEEDEAEDEAEDEEEDDFVSDDELDNIEEYDEFERDSEVDGTLNERVKGFDIAGITLGQDYDKVKDIMKERKYKMTKINYAIPEYFQFNYDAVCRDHNIYLPDAIKGCIDGLARKDKMRYISDVAYKNGATDEKVTVHFTSPVTFNKVWKIAYENDVNKKLGPAKNFQYQRDERRRAFWYNLRLKYGEPNVKPNHWVLDPKEEFKTELVAEFGKLTLYNQKQYLHDIEEAIKDARRKFKAKDFTF